MAVTRPNARTIYLLKRAETACRSGLEMALTELDVTPSQYTTISLLATQKDQSSAGLARRAGVSPQSMSEIITAIDAKGLIARKENPEHRRILTIRLTDKGRAILAKCEQRTAKLEAQLFAGLSAAEIEALRKALDHIASNSTRAETD